MKKKTKERYIDRGFGFPVAILNVPMVEIRGKWTPNIDHNLFEIEILKSLASFQGRLTGSQLKFVRHHFQLTLKDFAARFSVTHPAVIKWENSESSATGMNWSTEKDIRLFILNSLKSSAKEFHALYLRLEKVSQKPRVKLEISGDKVAA